MRNLVKEYIESGKSFEDLKTEYGINVNEFDNLICLNYNQIESPKSPNIVRQCRGIVLDKDTLEIVHYPFFRFFNLDEMPEERQKFNWNNAFGLQKIDGSLFGVFCHNGVWHITSRSQIGGFNKVTIGMLTFGDIFDMAIKGSRDEFFAKLDNIYKITIKDDDGKIKTVFRNGNEICKDKNQNKINIKDLKVNDEVEKI